MKLHCHIGLDEGEDPKAAKLTIKGRGKTHELTAEQGACVVEDIAPGTVINAIVKAPRKAAKARRAPKGANVRADDYREPK